MKNSLALSYAIKKRAMKKPNDMATHEDDKDLNQMGEKEMGPEGRMFAEGGEADSDDDYGHMEEPENEPIKSISLKPSYMAQDQDQEENPHDMVAKVMSKHKYSKGGEVANDTPIHADFEENDFDDLAKDDGLNFSLTGKNSGDELGNHQEDHDRGDIIAKILRSRAKKDKNPRPA